LLIGRHATKTVYLGHTSCLNC